MSMVWSHGGATFASWAYTYNDRGQRLSSRDITTRIAAYGYDDASRLVSETITGDPGGASFNGVLSYSLDGASNRLSRMSTLTTLGAQSFTYNANDEISADTVDANGNTITSGGHTYAYDFEDRLVSKDGGAVTIQYDCDGNRVAKTVGGVTTKYLVDDLNPTSYLQVLEELVGGAVQTRYTYGTRIVSQTRNVSSTPVASYYGFDAHGNITFLTDSTGAVTDSYDHDAWGILVASTGSTPNTRLFAGEEVDPDVGLINLRARQYTATTGRFRTIDPMDVVTNGTPRDAEITNAIARVVQPQIRSALEIAAPDRGVLGERAFAPLSLNRYLYGSGDPVTFVDPTGRNEAMEYVSFASDIFLYAHGVMALVSKDKKIQDTGWCLIPGGLAQLAGAKFLLKAPGLSIVGALLDIACSIGVMVQ
jgi:RHS repeat-associated protein